MTGDWLDRAVAEYDLHTVELALINARALGAHPLVIQQIGEILQNERRRSSEYHLTYG